MAATRHSRVYWGIIPTILSCLCALPVHAQYGGGTGGPDDPYQIATAEDLIALGNEPNDYGRHFVLTADIDLDPNLPGGRVFDRAVVAPDTGDDYNFQGTKFTGRFDGQGHVIRNLHIQGKDYLGLFGFIEKGAVVVNVGLEDANVNGVNQWDGLVGILAGRNFGHIALSYCTGTVRGDTYVGGLVGRNSGMVLSSYATSEVIGSKTTFLSQSDYVGGLAGGNSGSINACYSCGNVQGGAFVGGLVGDNGIGSVTTCYSTGRVVGDYCVGALVGENQVAGETGEVVASFWDIYASGQHDSAAGTGLTTAKMQTRSTFLNAGWDFVEETANGTCQFWQMQEGHYPELSVFAGAIPAEPNGLGTLEDPYRITDANELGAIWYRPWANYRLQADIDLTGIAWSAAVVPYFYGNLDGNGHVIRNLHIQGAGYLGLFGILASDASLIDMAIEEVDVHGNDEFIGNLAGANLGSVAGENRGNITSSYSIGSVSGEYGVIGGLVGRSSGAIMSSYSAGKVSGRSFVVVGGLVGYNSGIVTSSYSTSTVSGVETVGGLAGENAPKGRITSSYSTGPVSGDRFVGGFVGLNSYNTRIASCYSTGHVSGKTLGIGGLVGASYELDDVISSFWDTETSGLNKSPGGTGKTTAEMKQAKTFTDAGWDFADETVNGTEDIWWILEGQDYPQLSWERNTQP
jgi:hypothetical protein